jgi:hypothetical protein
VSAATLTIAGLVPRTATLASNARRRPTRRRVFYVRGAELRPALMGAIVLDRVRQENAGASQNHDGHH